MDLKPAHGKYLLLFIIFLGFLPRVVCILHHLPDFPQIEENLVIRTTLNLNISDLNPHDFIYPHLFYYLAVPLFSFCNLLFPSALMNPLHLNFFAVNVLIGRIIILILAIVHIILIYAIGRRLFDYRVGLIAALFLAMNPLHASLSYVVKPDMLMSLLVLLSFLFICNLYNKEGSSYIDYILIGLFIGLATATKYNGILGIAPLLVTHFTKVGGKSRFINKNLFLALVFIGLVFFLFNPFVILDFRHFINDIMSELHTATGGFIRNPLANKQGWINYPIALISILGRGIFILSICGLILSLCSHSKKDILILSFPVTYYIIMGSFKNSPAHYLLPIIPFILLLAAQFLIMLINTISRIKVFKKIRYGVVFLLSFIFILPSLQSVAYYNKWLTQKDTRILARDWIFNNIPPRAKILMDGVSEDISFIFGKTEKHPYQIHIINWKKEIDYQQFFKVNNFEFIIVDADFRNKPDNVKPLYNFIDRNFLLIKEFKPFINRPNFSYIYSPLHNPLIRIYDCRHKRTG